MVSVVFHVNGKVSLTETFLAVVQLLSDLSVGPTSFQLHPLHGKFSVTIDVFGSISWL